MIESIRLDKWTQAQYNKEVFKNLFNSFIYFDNSGNLDSIEEDITTTYKKINSFLEERSSLYPSYDWLKNRNKLNLTERFKLNESAKKDSKQIQKSTVVKYNQDYRAASPSEITPDNRAGEARWGDDIKGDTPARKNPEKTYTFRAYSESKGEEPKIKIFPEPKESNFSKDKEKAKSKKRFTDSPTVNQRMRNVDGVGQQFDTRQQGTVYPMSGLGDVTYREQTDVKSLLKRVREAIDDPGAVDMGVGGVLGGASNKEPLQTYKDQDRNIGIKIIKKKGKKNV